jgi:hypothetical protein
MARNIFASPLGIGVQLRGSLLILIMIRNSRRVTFSKPPVGVLLQGILPVGM